MGAAGLITIVAVALALSMPRTEGGSGGVATAPPEWTLRLSSPGRMAPFVLVYGTQSGVHIMRASPSSDGGLRSIGLVDRKLNVISLGLSPVAIQGDAAGAGALRSFGAEGRVVTVYRDDQGAGVRTGF